MADFKDITWETFNEYKQIDIFGNSLFVPIWTNCLTVDEDGEVTVWEDANEPYIPNYVLKDSTCTGFWEGGETSMFDKIGIGKVNLNGVDWKECIFEI